MEMLKGRATPLRTLAVAVAMLAALLVNVGPANAATYTWTASCGSGDYYHTGSLGASARVLQASSQCGVKAQVKCQRNTGATRWEIAPTWKFLGQVSTKYCSYPYNHARLSIGVVIGG